MLDLIATVIACCDGPREPGPGHPPAATVRVLATLRRFLREGTPWRSLTASEDMVSGSTLRRWLERWARGGVLAQVHALLVAMLRGDPTLILDSCSVRAKRAGDLTGPNPTDRGKQGTSTTSRSQATVCPSPAQRRRPTSMTRSSSSACSWPPSPSWPGSRPCSPTKGMMPRATATYAPFGAEPHIHKRGRPHGSGLGGRRWPVERSNAWVLESRRLALRYDRLGLIVQSLLQAAAYSWLQAGLPASSENRL